MSDETIIIGGGPAGSAAAIKLAKQGMPVRLLERKLRPHHKVCGEFISYEAAQYLDELGLDLAALGAEPIRHARFYNGESELIFNLPFTAWSLSRCKLDSALLEQAASAGAKVELGTTVRHLSRAGDGIAIALHTASLATRVHASGGDSKTYQRMAYKDLTPPVRNAELLASVLAHRLGRKAAFICARQWPVLLRAMILRTRVGQH